MRKRKTQFDRDRAICDRDLAKAKQTRPCLRTLHQKRILRRTSLHLAEVIRNFRAALKRDYPRMTRSELDARVREARQILRNA